MDKGKYFEWLALGGGAIGADDEVTDLPRVYGGKKSVDQQRIEEQAERFKRFFDKESPEFQGFDIIDTQVELRELGLKSKGTIDFVTKEINTGYIWINDLKLTNDVNNVRTKYGWGNKWSEMDMLQMIHYKDLYKDAYEVVPRVALWVFDYSPSMGIKLGEIVISENATKTKNIRLNSALEVINLYEDNGWITTPSEYECRGCPLKCPDRFTAGLINKFIVNI